MDERREPRGRGPAPGFPEDDEGLPMVGETWGLLMTRLKEYAETGKPNPFFTVRVRSAPMKVDVLTEAVIAVPRDRVAACAADPSHAPVWYENIVSVAWQTPPPAAVGCRIAFTARFLGRHLSYTYEITAYVPGRLPVMRTSESPFPMDTTCAWEPYGEVGDHTRMTLRNRGEPSGFASVAEPVPAAAMRRAQGKDLARPKDLLERQAATSE
ncbi:SRPBCC family protein [Streptomyces sp. NPDC051366]|uniref:SRPBCC family protein n=1 Tax=Streptomyces sp. NPDC051366 TaxID=3365652 RepID=UPI003794CA50